jgi:hypothetical protein
MAKRPARQPRVDRRRPALRKNYANTILARDIVAVTEPVCMLQVFAAIAHGSRNSNASPSRCVEGAVWRVLPPRPACPQALNSRLDVDAGARLPGFMWWVTAARSSRVKR